MALTYVAEMAIYKIESDGFLKQIFPCNLRKLCTFNRISFLVYVAVTFPTIATCLIKPQLPGQISSRIQSYLPNVVRNFVIEGLPNVLVYIM